MAKVVIPDGTTTSPRLGGGSALTGNRQSSYRFDLLDKTGKKIGVLDGVQGGSVSWTSDANVRGAGQITVSGQTNINWSGVRVKPVLIVDESLPEQPCGVFLPAAPTGQWDSGGGTFAVDLLDRVSILDQDAVDATYTVAAGTNLVTAITTLIATTGEAPGAVTASSLTVSADMVWQAGTSKLQIANDMLSAAGCYPLWADLQGQFRVEPYRAPSTRPVVYEFLDDDDSIYLPSHSIEDDIYSVPNKYVAIASGSASTPGVIGIATNTNPASPFSYANRGRWVTQVEQSVEISVTTGTLQDAINAYATTALSKATPSMTIPIQHGSVPGLFLDDVVRFRRQGAGIDGHFSVASTSIDFDPSALASTTLVEVVSL